MIPGPDAFDHLARVLVVDDERRNRDLLEVMLVREGYEVRIAATGEDAFAIINEWSADLVLLDVMMPDMDGYEVARRIKSNHATKNIPVIMVSALDDRDSRMLGLRAGAEEFLAKPVDRAELSVRVRNLLRLKAYSDYYDAYSQALESDVAARTAELVESERLYRETFDSAPVAIVHLGLDGRWLRVNQKACDLLGYSRAELQGIEVSDLLQSEHAEDEAAAIRELADGARDHHVQEEKRFRRRSGGFVWAKVNMSVHRNAEGKSQHLIAVIEDVTERRTLEAQLRQTNKMDAVGQLASGVAHDFNNLLTVILGSAELINADVHSASRHGEELIEIIKASQRASVLTKQLLAFSRQQVLRAETIDLNALIANMAGMLERLIGKQIEVVTSAAPDLDLTLADRGQIEQVVMNLVVNARDAMPHGGRVTIETKNVELENSEFHQEAIVAGSYVMLAVSDNGVGMNRETRKHLFEPFFTTKESGKGTGLGLSTTYGIVKQSKGYVWVYSEVGVGTTFKIFLPRAAGDGQLPQPVSVVAVPAAPAKETVLLVEDESSVRRLVKRILDEAGYRVVEAANGTEAERLFIEAVEPIDLLVTDIVMPECRGPELLDRLHVYDPALRVLYMSGYADLAAAHHAGIDAGQCFVQKPFTVAKFMNEVRGALAR